MLVISPVKNGVRRASRPAMMRIESVGAPSSVSSSRKSATLTIRRRGPRFAGEPAQPFEVASILAGAPAAVAFSAAIVRLPTTASGVEPVSALEAAERFGQRGIEEDRSWCSPLLPTPRWLRRRLRSAVTRGLRPPGLSFAPAWTVGHPPAAAMARVGGECVAQLTVVLTLGSQVGERVGEVAVLEGRCEQETRSRWRPADCSIPVSTDAAAPAPT